MTYCVAIKLGAGLVFASDSRTNAGVDNIARFEKMRVFNKDGDRVIVTLSAGNPSVTQNAQSLLELRARNEPQNLSIWNAKSLFEVAGLIGDAMRKVRARDEMNLRAQNIDASASFIVGGQIAGETQRLFLVYSEGDFIESSDDTPVRAIRRNKIWETHSRPHHAARFVAHRCGEVHTRRVRFDDPFEYFRRRASRFADL